MNRVYDVVVPVVVTPDYPDRDNAAASDLLKTRRPTRRGGHQQQQQQILQTEQIVIGREAGGTDSNSRTLFSYIIFFWKVNERQGMGKRVGSEAGAANFLFSP